MWRAEVLQSLGAPRSLRERIAESDCRIAELAEGAFPLLNKADMLSRLRVGNAAMLILGLRSARAREDGVLALHARLRAGHHAVREE